MDTQAPNETKTTENKDIEKKPENYVEKNVEVGRYLTPIAVVLGSIVIATAFYFGHGSAPAPTATP